MIKIPRDHFTFFYIITLIVNNKVWFSALFYLVINIGLRLCEFISYAIEDSILLIPFRTYTTPDSIAAFITRSATLSATPGSKALGIT